MTEPPRLDFARLLDWVEGRLPADEAQLIAAQVAHADAPTRAQIAWLRSFQAVSKAVVLEAPPAETRTELTARFAAYAREQRGPSIFQRVLATLSFDSARQPAAAGVRAAGVNALVRQLVYTTDVADVALAIQPRAHDQSLDLSGQLLPKQALDPAIFQVSLQRDQAEIATTQTDDLGEFTFEALDPGSYTITLAAEAIGIVLAAIELRR